MKMARHPLRWLPPFVVGVSAATGAEVSVGLLLYGGPGLVRSLTTILAVEAAALGAGLWTAPAARSDLVESLRTRWLFCLLAYLVATLFAAFWSVVEAVGGTALGQGLGLAFLAALPLYAVGGVIGAMGAIAEMDSGGGTRWVGGTAALGAALGFGATGASLPQVFTPASLLLVCLVLLSGGGLVYGSVLEARLRVHVRARRPCTLGEVRIEDRQLVARDRYARVLLEGGHVRRWRLLREDAPEPWDVAALTALVDPGSDACKMLFMGGGASTMPRTALQRYTAVQAEVLERSLPVLELAREHLETALHDGADGRLRLRVGNLEDEPPAEERAFRLVVVDTAALAPQGGVPSLSARLRASVLECVSPDGHLVLGPLEPEPGSWEFPATWARGRYARPAPSDLDELGSGLPDAEVLWVGTPSADGLPDRLGGFQRDSSGLP
jgi:hypothetical protein